MQLQSQRNLRRIFDTETQSTGNAAGASVAFADIESSMYERRRRELPILPTDANDVAPRITGIHFEMCNGQQFFRGSVSLKISPHLKCVATLPCEMTVLKATIENKSTSVKTHFQLLLPIH